MPAFLVTLAAPALAGDFADREILGFSADGGIFAFEEYGEFDGSGGGYSNIYLVNTATNTWLDGTPVRVKPEDVDVPLAAVRAEAARKARPILAKYGIVTAGVTVVSNPATELSNNPYSIRFLTDKYANWTDRGWTLTLTPLPFPEPAGCENLGPTRGFRLVLANPAGIAETLQEDEKLPASRGCAQDYAITEVITFKPERFNPVMIVLLNIVTQGFEGPDRRYLAVATHFQDD
jgi:predicted secreted protein